MLPRTDIVCCLESQLFCASAAWCLLVGYSSEPCLAKEHRSDAQLAQHPLCAATAMRTLRPAPSARPLSCAGRSRTSSWWPPSPPKHRRLSSSPRFRPRWPPSSGESSTFTSLVSAGFASSCEAASAPHEINSQTTRTCHRCEKQFRPYQLPVSCAPPKFVLSMMHSTQQAAQSACDGIMIDAGMSSQAGQQRLYLRSQRPRNLCL